MSTPAPSGTLTIGHLARAAHVGIETVRYYQQRALLPVPDGRAGVRRYPAALVDRIRFIKRAQELGFSLDEVGELLRLEDGGSRDAIRRVAAERLAQIDHKLADLGRMRQLLGRLLDACAHTAAESPCPIIGSFAAPER